MPNEVKMKTRWENEAFPAEQKIKRGLLIEVTGQEIEDRNYKERPAINLALVIDRSGSMRGSR